MTIDIDELSRMHESTTKGEWGVSTPRRSGREHVYVDCETMVADCCRGVPREQCESNAAWIAAAHNAWQGISDEIQRLREENAKLDENLSTHRNAIEIVNGHLAASHEYIAQRNAELMMWHQEFGSFEDAITEKQRLRAAITSINQDGWPVNKQGEAK